MNRRSILFGLMAGGAGAALGGGAFAKGQAPGWREALAAAAAARVEAGESVGLQIAVNEAGGEAFSQGFGAANLETGTPLSADSVLRVGSVTKQFTAAVALQLQQEGRLSLDDALARHLPEVPRAADISLRRMLNHTAGIANSTDYPTREALMQAARTDRTTDQLLAELTARQPFLTFEPGTAWAYSNSGYLLMGVIIERLEGRPLAEVYRDRLFQPLGLTRTAMDNAADVVPGRASGYSRSQAGPVNASFVSMTVPAAAGALRSTASDLCRWTDALHEGRVVSAASLAEMLTPGRLADGSQPKDSRGRPVDYGLGLRLIDKPGVGRIVTHDGDFMGFSCQVRRLVDRRTSMAVIANFDGFRAFEPLNEIVDRAG